MEYINNMKLCIYMNNFTNNSSQYPCVSLVILSKILRDATQNCQNLFGTVQILHNYVHTTQRKYTFC